MHQEIICIAPAKINLCLHITGRRADGYHDLESAVAFTQDIADILIFTPAKHDDFDGLFGADNLVIRALTLYRAHTDFDEKFHIRLEKNIPIGAGLGGGSADAAACLRFLNTRNPNPLSAKDMISICDQIGADVACCYRGTPHIMGGTGSDYISDYTLPASHGLVIFPQINVTTIDIFKNLKAEDFSHSNPSSFWEDLSVKDWNKKTGNDMQRAATEICPAIISCLEQLQQTDSVLFSRMSGSGSACFGLYPTRQNAEQAAARIKEKKPEWFIRAFTFSMNLG